MAIFDTKIDTRGPNGNIFAILGTAKQLMKELGQSPDKIDQLVEDVTTSSSYEEACKHIEKYFRLIK